MAVVITLLLTAFLLVMVVWLSAIVHNWWVYREARRYSLDDLLTEEDRDQIA